MKAKLLSLPQRIRMFRKELAHWMPLRQQNPVMGRDHLQETAERECLRLAGILDRLETQQREQMARIEEWRKTPLANKGLDIQKGK